MAFTTITAAEIAAGEPTKQELFNKIKDNFDDHESRLSTVEVGFGTLTPIQFDVLGPGRVVDGITFYKNLRNIRVLGVKLYVWKAGTAGIQTIDVEYKRGVNPWTSILSAPISASFGLGDGATVAGSLAFTDLDVNDQLRLNIDAIQTDPYGFSVYIEHEGR